MPFGALRPLRMVFTSRVPPRSTTAYTFFDRRLLTNTLPFPPRASERASGMPSAQTSTLKPAGTFSLSVGRSFVGRPVRCGANGWSVDSLSAGGLPWCHDGGGAAAGLSWAWATVNAAMTAAATATLMFLAPRQEALLELKACLDANSHVAARRRLVEAAVGLVDDHRADVVAVGQIVDARELGDAPAAPLLHQPGHQVKGRISIGELGIGIVDRDAGFVERLEL